MIEERVSDFGELSGDRPVVPHLDTTAASSSGDGAGPAFVVGLLGIDDKRGSNRGNNKKVAL